MLYIREGSISPDSCIYSSMMLDRVLRKKLLVLTLNACLNRRTNEIVEQERAVHQQGKTENLKPLEGLPAEAKRDNPDEESAAGIDGGAGGRADSPGDG